MRPNPSTAANHSLDRSGFSLLEVLVSSGILVIGLASVAALLPAAASRMRQAVIADRAGVLAANAYADIMARRSHGILAADNLTGGNLLVFGSNMGANGIANKLRTFVTGRLATPANLVRTPGTLFLDNQKQTTDGSESADWDNQDSLEFTPNGDSLPLSSVAGTARVYKPEICWLATIATATPSPPAGSPAWLSVAIFAKPTSNVDSFELTGTSGVYTVKSPLPPADLRRVFRSCSYVLDHRATDSPRWLRVTAAWAATDVADDDGDGDKTDTVMKIILSPTPTATLPITILGFENLVRVDTHAIHLD